MIGMHDVKTSWPVDLHGQMSRRWAALTPEDVAYIDGDFVVLIEVLQEEYGYPEEYAEAEAKAFFRDLGRESPR